MMEPAGDLLEHDICLEPSEHDRLQNLVANLASCDAAGMLVTMHSANNDLPLQEYVLFPIYSDQPEISMLTQMQQVKIKGEMIQDLL